MPQRKYPFIVEETGEKVYVDHETMFTKDCTGRITLPDGRAAKEDRSNWTRRITVSQKEEGVKERQCVSDAMGFPEHQFEEFEADRKLMGFSGIEFKKEPDMPFYQVVGKAGSEWERYMKHRGFVDRNRHDKGYTLSPSELQKGAAIIQRHYNKDE